MITKKLDENIYVDDCILRTGKLMTSPPWPQTTICRKPIIFAIVGKSASGKDYLAKMLVKEIPPLKPIVSWTTRPPREGEKNGVDYNFVSTDEFVAAREKGAFIEWSSFNGWFYGTPHSAVKPDNFYAGVFNLDGLASLMQHQDQYDVVPIYMRTPWPVRLKRSIMREHKLSKEMIRRMFADHQDFAHDKYNLIKGLCRNEGLDLDNFTVKQLPAIVTSWVWSYISFFSARNSFIMID